MSALTYIKLYKEAEADLRSLLPIDLQLTTSSPIEDRESGFKWVAKHYIRYINIVNKLGLCYDQMTDPLKLGIMRKLLDASVGRLLELKMEMVREEMSDFQYLDPICFELKITKHDIAIQVPRYYRIDRREQLSKMNEDIDQIIYNLENPVEENETTEEENNPDEEEEEVNKEENLTPAEKKKKELMSLIERKDLFNPEKLAFINTILLIQRHERARRERLIARKVYENKKLQEDIAWHRYTPIPRDQLALAVKNIQRFWRGYSERLHLKARDTRLRLLIGEIQSSYSITPQRWEIEKVEEMRRRCRKDAAIKWDNAIDASKKKLLNPQQREDIGDEVRYFILSWFRIIAELPMFPDDELMLPPPGLLGLPKGCPDDFETKYCPPVEPLVSELLLKGSALIVAGFWITPQLYELAYTATVVEKKKNAGKKPKPKLTAEQIKQKKLEDKEAALALKLKMEAEVAENRSKGLYVVNSCFMDEFRDRLEDSRLEWRLEEPLAERAGLQVMRDIHLDIREEIDDRMREELTRLQNALNIDRSKKKKPEKSKKKKKKKKKGKQKGKDLTKNRTLESLFEELVSKGIIQKYPYVDIDELYGDEGYCNSDLRSDPYYDDPLPKYGDLRQVVKEYCVLNVMGPRIKPETGPRGTTLAPIRSVLLFGPRGSGKRSLVDGVCTLLGAVKFDLTPSNLRGKFTDKKEVKMLVHLISKVPRLLQPAVIFIHGGEKPFYKKVPKDEKPDNPKMLKKHLTKLMREIKPDDRIIFLATSDAPWMGAAASMVKMYEKILPVLNPDYSTRYSYVHSLLMAYHGVDRDFPTSVVAKMSDGYSLQVLEEAVRAVLTTRRICLLKPKPLHPMEFYEYLMTKKQLKVTPEERQKQIDWYNRTYPLAIRRKAKLIADKEIRLKLESLKNKPGNKKK